MTGTTPETAAFLTALDDLEQALGRSLEMTDRMRARIAYLREQIAAGRPLPQIVPAEDRPLLVQLLTESANLLHTYGTRVRRTEARALHNAGMTMDEIARLFGVSRQRVSALLRGNDAEEDEAAPYAGGDAAAPSE
jgi:predicted XRE-type DNA-binding protein